MEMNSSAYFAKISRRTLSEAKPEELAGAIRASIGRSIVSPALEETAKHLIENFSVLANAGATDEHKARSYLKIMECAMALTAQGYSDAGTSLKTWVEKTDEEKLRLSAYKPLYVFSGFGREILKRSRMKYDLMKMAEAEIERRDVNLSDAKKMMMGFPNFDRSVDMTRIGQVVREERTAAVHEKYRGLEQELARESDIRLAMGIEKTRLFVKSVEGGIKSLMSSVRRGFPSQKWKSGPKPTGIS